MDPELEGTENEQGSVDTGDANITIEPVSRRDLISAAFDEETERTEAAEAGDKPEGAVDKTTVQEGKGPADTGKPAQGDGKPVEGSKGTKPLVRDPTDAAPAQWKPTAKQKWTSVDPEIRAEVIRREREAAQVITATTAARQFVHAMGQVLGPHQARLQAMGVEPTIAVEKLLRSDYMLSTLAPAPRAQLMAKMISDYGVDLEQLDRALGAIANGTAPAGGKPAVDPLLHSVTQLLDQRLAPINQHLDLQRQQGARAEQEETERLISEVDQMEAQPEKYPYFASVREDMADIIELSAKKGVYLTTTQAYNKACAINPDVSAQLAEQRVAEKRRIAATASDTRARAALAASRQVAGSRTGTPTKVVVSPTDRRATIAAAFDSLDGR